MFEGGRPAPLKKQAQVILVRLATKNLRRGAVRPESGDVGKGNTSQVRKSYPCKSDNIGQSKCLTDSNTGSRHFNFTRTAWIPANSFRLY